MKVIALLVTLVSLAGCSGKIYTVLNPDLSTGG